MARQRDNGGGFGSRLQRREDVSSSVCFGDGDGLPGPLLQSTTNQAASDHRELFSHCSGGWEAGISASAGPCSASLPRFPLAFRCCWQSLVCRCIPPRSLPLLSRGHLLPVSPYLWLFSKHIHRCWGLRPSCLLVRHVSTRDSDRRAITSMKAPFQLQSAMHRPAPSFCWQGSYGKEVAREKPTMGLRRHDFSP